MFWYIKGSRGCGVMGSRCAFGYSSGLFIQYLLLVSFILRIFTLLL